MIVPSKSNKVVAWQATFKGDAFMTKDTIYDNTLNELMSFLNSPDRFNLVHEMIESFEENESSIVFGKFTGNNDFINLKKIVKKSKNEKTFAQYLNFLADEKGFKNDKDLYFKANQSREYHHKILSGKITPGKKKIISYAIVLKANNHELNTLLKKAGHALKDTPEDSAIHWFFYNKIYDAEKIHEYMNELGLQSIYS